LSLNRGGTVVFKDPGLDAAIRSHLGTIEEGISLGQLNRITTLDASSYQIKDLSGIENLPRLEVLNLENNSITDLSPLSKIDSLRELNLRNNGILSLKKIRFSSIIDLPITKTDRNCHFRIFAGLRRKSAFTPNHNCLPSPNN